MEYLHLLFHPQETASISANHEPIKDKDDLHVKVSTVSNDHIQLLGELSIKTYHGFVIGIKFVLIKTKKLIIESIKIIIITSTVFVFIKATTPSLANKDNLITIIAAPIVEEIIFRGFILTTIELTQEVGNQIRRKVYKIEPSETDLESQKIFRVRLTATLFGLAHLRNHKSFSAAAAFQVTHCIIGGLSTGYLKERTNSLALPIISHISNNYIAKLGTDILACWFINEYCWYKYATRETKNPVENLSSSSAA